MEFDHGRSLAFLLARAAVPMAGCPSSSDGTATGTDGTTGDTTSTGPTTEPTSLTLTTNDTMTMAADSTGEPTTDPSTDPTTDGTTTDPGETTTTDGTTTEPGETTTTDDDTTTSGSTDDTTTTGGDATLCEDAAAHIVECVPQYAQIELQIVAYCSTALADYEAYSRECGNAGEEYFACIAVAPCQGIQGNMPCAEEAAAVDAVCGHERRRPAVTRARASARGRRRRRRSRSRMTRGKLFGDVVCGGTRAGCDARRLAGDRGGGAVPRGRRWRARAQGSTERTARPSAADEGIAQQRSS